MTWRQALDWGAAAVFAALSFYSGYHRIECYQVGWVYDVPVRYRFWSGCHVQIADRWFPIDQIRVVK